MRLFVDKTLLFNDENTDLRDQLEMTHFRIAQMSRRIYGNVSERIIDPDQQLIPGLLPDPLMLWKMMMTMTILMTVVVANHANVNQLKKRRGRLKLPDHLPRVDQIIEPDAEALRRHPRSADLVIVREVTEKLDYVAGGFQVIRVIRPVYGIPHSDEPTMSAPPPKQVVDRGLPTDRTVAMVL